MTSKQIKFLNMLDEYGYDVFSTEMIKNTNLFNTSEINTTLVSLTKTGLIKRLERGKFIKGSFFEDSVIANFLARDGGIAYFTALNAHGLTEQFANYTYVQTAMRKKDITDGAINIKFIMVSKNKLLGYKNYGYGNHEYKMTDIEKTIADCFDFPQYAGWYQETIKAFNRAKIKQGKLIKYCKAINSNSLIKRLGFLSEFLHKPDMELFIDYAQKNINNNYTLFEIGGNKEGEYNSRWKLILNMPKEELLEIAKS